MTVETTETTNTDVIAHNTGSMDVQALMERIGSLEQRVAELEDAPAQGIEDRVSMVVFSGDMDKTIASFIIATGAAAMGLEVSMFFTFWGLSAVKKERKIYKGKNLVEKAFTAMLPAGTSNLGLSQMNFFGAGAAIMRKLMKDHEVTSLPEMVEMAQEMGVKMTVCDMSRELLGVKDDELIDGLELGGVASFMGDAAASKVTLFI
jgi:peroxiredoxin family protein